MTLRRFALVCCAVLGSLVSTRGDEPEALLFAYFTQNGADGLHLAWSRDGFAWEKLVGGASVLRPTVGAKEKLIRDPSVACGPDGTFHVVWTSGWWEHGIGYASTRDFIHWSTPREIPVMAREAAARNCWAPEIVWDPEAAEFLILWATTIPGCYSVGSESSENGLNHRIYYTATKDFAEFTPARTLFDFEFSAIDATLLKVGRDWHLFFKDETRYPQPAKNLLHATAPSPRGPFTHLSTPFSPAKLWVEGPSVVRFNGEYLLYFDAYIEKHYGVLRSRDLAHWEDSTRQLRLPDEGTALRPRHGAVIAVPQEIITGLQQLKLAP